MKVPVAPAPQLRRWGWGITVASLLAIGWATLLPEPGQTPGEHFCLFCGIYGGVDAALNLVLFAPLGAGLGLLGVRTRHVVLLMFALSASIELAQLLAISGRDATIGDVVMNTLGGWLGFELTRHASAWLRPSAGTARLLVIVATIGWLLIQGVSNYIFAVSLPTSRYYGQLARSIGHLEVFKGQIFAAGIDGTPIPNSAFDDSATPRRALLVGEPVFAKIGVPGPTRGIAPIVRIADADQREIVLLAQNGTDAAFGVRTGAADLRLRRTLFVLPRAFEGASKSGASRSDSISVVCSYTGRGSRMVVKSPEASTDMRVEVRASLAWSALLPFDLFLSGSLAEGVASAVWTAGVIVPLGFWVGWLIFRMNGRTSRARAVLIALGIAVPLIVVGLLAIPRIFGINTGSAADFLTAAFGVVLGVSILPRESYLPTRSNHQ